MGLQPITHIEIKAADHQKLMQFYADVLGWQLLMSMDEMAYSYFSAGNVTGGIDSNAGRNGVGTLIYVDTADIDNALTKITELGGKMIQPKTEVPNMGWYAWFNDPSGNTLALFQNNGSADDNEANMQGAGRALVHIEITAAERLATAQFYEKAFGWSYVDMPDFDYTGFNVQEGMGGGYPTINDMNKVGEVLLYFASDDLAADSAKVEAHGGKIIGEKVEVTGFGEYQLWQDPDGNRMAFWRSTSR